MAETEHRFTMPESRAELIHKMTEQHIGSLHNWIATAVEQGDLEKAQKLVVELRQHQEIFAAFNMEAKHTIAGASSKPLETEHVVRPRR